jgi:hypothetical protein
MLECGNGEIWFPVRGSRFPVGRSAWVGRNGVGSSGLGRGITAEAQRAQRNAGLLEWGDLVPGLGFSVPGGGRWTQVVWRWGFVVECSYEQSKLPPRPLV